MSELEVQLGEDGEPTLTQRWKTVLGGLKEDIANSEST